MRKIFLPVMTVAVIALTLSCASLPKLTGSEQDKFAYF